MNLLEYQGKQLLKDAGFLIPRGVFVSSVEDLENSIKSLPEQVVLKVQIPTGKRGKAGGVVVVPKKAAATHAKRLLGKEINGFVPQGLLIEASLDIKEEWYLSVNVERSEKGFVAIFSKKGGMDIEELHRDHPEDVQILPFPLPDDLDPRVRSLLVSLKTFAKKQDLMMVEINPLILTSDDELYLADAKMIVDESAFYRQLELEKLKTYTSDLEKEASRFDLAYVELDGDLAVIGNGAGLVMATLDMLDHFGGRAANFCDVGGGADKEHVLKAASLVLEKEGVKGLLVNIFGGITRCDQVAEGLIAYQKSHHLTIPIVIRMVGTNQEEGRKLLLDNGIVVRDSMEEAAKELIHLTR